MPSFYIPARDSRHRIACFALYRALLRQIPGVSLPPDLISRPDWINPIQYLIRSGFRRNKNDTSPRLVTSALRAGYCFLALLARAQDASSTSYAEVITFLRNRQKAFPPPRPPPVFTPPKPRPIPLLTKVSGPGQRPVYKATVRPLPLCELSGGTRKVPVLEDAQGIPFLRIGKPESHAHANFLKHKSLRRQLRITAFQELWEERRHEAAEEDMWEDMLEELADREGVSTPDVGDEGGPVNKAKLPRQGAGPYEWTTREYGVNYISAKLREEMVDMQARTTALLDLRDEEERLAEMEKREKKENRKTAWKERVRLAKERGPPDEGPGDEQPTPVESESREQKDVRDPFSILSKDDWVENITSQAERKGQKTKATKANPNPEF